MTITVSLLIWLDSHQTPRNETTHSRSGAEENEEENDGKP